MKASTTAKVKCFVALNELLNLSAESAFDDSYQFVTIKRCNENTESVCFFVYQKILLNYLPFYNLEKPINSQISGFRDRFPVRNLL